MAKMNVEDLYELMKLHQKQLAQIQNLLSLMADDSIDSRVSVGLPLAFLIQGLRMQGLLSSETTAAIFAAITRDGLRPAATERIDALQSIAMAGRQDITTIGDWQKELNELLQLLQGQLDDLKMAIELVAEDTRQTRATVGSLLAYLIRGLRQQGVLSEPMIRSAFTMVREKLDAEANTRLDILYNVAMLDT